MPNTPTFNALLILDESLKHPTSANHLSEVRRALTFMINIALAKQGSEDVNRMVKELMRIGFAGFKSTGFESFCALLEKAHSMEYRITKLPSGKIQVVVKFFATSEISGTPFHDETL